MSHPYYADDSVTLHHGDALATMRAMPDASVDLVATDPPYFRVKDEPWDRAWDNAHGFLAWMGELCAEWRRVLKPNGSLYVFASPQMARCVGNVIADHFAILTDIRWRKPPFATKAEMVRKEGLRAPFPASETIWFAEQIGADEHALAVSGLAAARDRLRTEVFWPLLAYLDGERERAAFTRQMCDAVTGNQMAVRYFSGSMFKLPTAPSYAALRAAFNAGGGAFLSRDYDDVRREYDLLKREYDARAVAELAPCERTFSEVRRAFQSTGSAPYTDVWDFPTVGAYHGKHPCEKPVTMMEHIVRTSSRPDDVVLDCFAGSGSTLVAAKHLGRRAIGVEGSARHCREIAERLSQGVLFAEGAA